MLLDQVFNHTDNGWNPLWGMILEHPGDEFGGGGLYFEGATPWGNRVATEKLDVQNMLIDACKLFLVEYHVDGFRFDATHRTYMDHGFLGRLADELKRMKPNVLLVAENFQRARPEPAGFGGFAQWVTPFTTDQGCPREGPFGSTPASPMVSGLSSTSARASTRATPITS